MTIRLNSYSKVSTKTEVPTVGIGSAMILYTKRGTTTTMFGGALYGFAIYQVIPGGVLAPLPIEEFFFPVSPKSISLEEPPALNIQYTQGAGRFIEHQGSTMKTLNVSGTTGFRPMQGMIPFMPDGIIPIPTPNYSPTTFLFSPEVLSKNTGMQHFLKLRNLFRMYTDLKSCDLTSQRHVMVWFNMKEGEYFVVEPMNFTGQRDSSSPMTFTYNIQCQVIDFADGMGLLPTRDFIAWRALVSTVNPLQPVVDLLDFGDSLLDDFKVSSEILKASFADAAEDLVDRVGTVQIALEEYRNTGQIDSSTLNVATARSIMTTVDAINTKIGSNTDPSSPVSSLTTSDLYYRTEHTLTKTYRYAAQMNALVLDTISKVQGTTIPSRYRQPGQSYVEATRGDYPALNADSNSTALSPGFINNTPSAFTYDRVNGNEDIYRAAQRLLGDISYWKILVKVNRLEPPYISSQILPGRNVLHPGDIIKVPQFGGGTGDTDSVVTNSPLSQTGIAETQGLKSLGTDIGLLLTSNGVETVMDLATTRSGDLEIVSGTKNVQQALNMKLIVERGTLPLHPEYGLLKLTGNKGTISLAVQQSIAFKSTMLSDKRVESVDKVSVTINGDTVQTKGDVKLRAVKVSVGTSLSTSV